MQNRPPAAPFSLPGKKLTRRSGILELMDDLGRALTTDPGMCMLGGGNPAVVPEIQAKVRARMRELLDDGGSFDRMLGNYDPPQGNPLFIRALACLLQRTYGWDVGPENIAVTCGGQTAFFYLFNLLAGPFEGERRRKILLPFAPEYIGYADQGIHEGLFITCRPDIEWPEGEKARTFKYRIDFPALEAILEREDIAAIAASRPTNPTGNVLTDGEVGRLSELALARGIPLILDKLYGRLKARKVLTVPGEYFFFGLDEDWPHCHECLRLNFSQPADMVREAAQIIAEEAARAQA